MSEPESAERVPPRRVSMTVTGYLTAHTGGWYDLASSADGAGQKWSVPDFAVDEASVRDLPAETLTAEDWGEIGAYVTARLGPDQGGALLAQFHRLADAMADRFEPVTYIEGVPAHPGVSMTARLKQIGMSQADLARSSGYSPKHVSQIATGTAGLSTDFALVLERELGVPAAVWTGLEAAYREFLARGKAAGR